MYTVKQVAALTGVAEATLRVWERRYAIVQPARSTGGYRLYDDRQLALLREMAGLVDAGVPASRAADTVRTSFTAAAGGHLQGLPGVGDLIEAAASLDPAGLATVIGQAFASGPFEEVADTWLLPQLGRLGDAWVSGRLTIAQEHFASAGLMRAIAGVYDRAGAGGADAGAEGEGGSVVVGLPAGERHELPLFAFAACLRRRGVNVVYLGADVPTAEWRVAVARRHARAAVVGVTSPGAVVTGQAVVDELRAAVPPLGVWVGGSRRSEVAGAHALPDAVSEAAAHLHRSLLAGRI